MKLPSEGAPPTPKPPPGAATNPPIHEWRVPSSTGEHVRTPGSTNWHALSTFMPPSPPNQSWCRFFGGGGGGVENLVHLLRPLYVDPDSSPLELFLLSSTGTTQTSGGGPGFYLLVPTIAPPMGPRR